MTVARFSLQPDKPRAGRVLTGRLLIRRAGRAVSLGATSCYATAAGKVVPASRIAFAASTAICAWRLPPGTAGKRVRGSVSVNAQGSRASRTFVRTIVR